MSQQLPEPRPSGDNDGVPDIPSAVRRVATDGSPEDSLAMAARAAGLSAEELSWVEAWIRYLQQLESPLNAASAADAFASHPAAARALVGLFRARLQPGCKLGEEDAEAGFATALAEVADEDRNHLFATLAALVRAILRCNVFLDPAPEALAFKFRSADVPDMPRPRPWCEIWVTSPRVEGIHLRGGPIARGGIRWSDRPQDFRTEVLALLKAQMVKNAIIVPTGAKGGFVARQLPDPEQDRDAWGAEGRAAYRIFIAALLSLTDNRDTDGRIMPAPGIRRRDGDDSYLVVAADKGTASFSDIANQLSTDAGYWLGDAFSSGGSSGYSHKRMGITARGAWISVTRHFAELGIDVQQHSITVAGVGDMSGDVFGNGMLRSPMLKLVAAFDHRHIFLDPDPDPATSFRERTRLQALRRSSWADYDKTLISAGGGVHSRHEKTIPLSPQLRGMLGIEVGELPPEQLIAAILRAPVDLLWFGGIGTYLKGAHETAAMVGDHANDACRVNGREVRARVVGEGANLGATQAARIEYARQGGRINCDFIDNSAGVDTSDLEVNIKIALTGALRDGHLALSDRDQLLTSMTDEVAALVLADNRAQTLALSVAETTAPAMLARHEALMQTFEADGLDRQLEGLPDRAETARRQQAGEGLWRPELALLLSHAKTALQKLLAGSALLDDALVEADLLQHFPSAIQQRFADDLRRHPLRGAIIATAISSQLVDHAGPAVADHLVRRNPGTSPVDVVAAFVAARELFNLRALWWQLDQTAMPAAIALQLHAEAAHLLRAVIAHLLAEPDVGTPSPLVARLRSLAPAPDTASAPALALQARLDELQAPLSVRTQLLMLAAGDEWLAGMADSR